MTAQTAAGRFGGSTLTALIVASAFFMEQLDGTVIVTALPRMATTFHVQSVDVSIGMTAYLVALAAFIPLSGWIADRLGARTTFCTAIVFFTLTSVVCGLSTSLPAFVAARIAQGIAGAMMVPVGRLVVLRGTAKSELLRAISFLTWPGLIAPVIGPPVGGFIVTYFAWPWIFFLNIPIGILGLALALQFIPRIDSLERRPFDLIGFFLTASSLAAVMFGLDRVSRGDEALSSWLLVVTGTLLCLLAVRHMRRAATPLLSLAALAIPTFRAGTIGAGTWFRVAIQTAPFLLPLLFQIGLGKTAFASGMLMLWYAAGNLAMKTLTTPTLQRFGFRNVATINGTIVTLSLLACGLIAASTPDIAIAIVLFLSGLCRSLQYTTVNTLAFVDIPQPMMSSASTLSGTLTQLASAGGIALGALLLRAVSSLRATPGVLDATDFRIALWLTAFVTLAATLTLLRLPANTGADVSGRSA